MGKQRLNRIIIPVLSKLSIEELNKWNIDRVQKYIKLLTGVLMKQADDFILTESMQEEIIKNFEDERGKYRSAKEQISMVQEGKILHDERK